MHIMDWSGPYGTVSVGCQQKLVSDCMNYDVNGVDG